MFRIAGLYRNAFSGLSQASWWLSFVMLVNRSGTMAIPFLSLYLTERMHFTIGQTGQVLSVYGLGAICGGFLGGRLTDSIGYYATLLLTLTSGGLLFLILGQVSSTLAIYCVTFFLALLNDAFRPANSSAIAAYSTDTNRTRSFSLNRLAINLGWAVGGAIGGFVAAHDYKLLFWIDGLTNLLAALLLILVLKPQNNQPTLKQTPQKKNSAAYKDTAFMCFILLTITFGSCFFQHFSTIPLFYRNAYQLGPSFIGMTMALNGILIVLFEMTLVYKLELKPDHTKFIALGLILTSVGFSLYNLTLGGIWTAVCFTLILTLAEMLSMPFMNSYWVRRTNDSNRGSYAGWYSAAWSIAQVAGPFAGTQIVQHLGFSVLWWSVCGVSLAGALGFLLLGKHSQAVRSSSILQ